MMRPSISSYLFNRLAGQLLALFVLYISLAWLLPIISTTLFDGMLLWSNRWILYCWFIQCACIAVTIELRDSLIKKVVYWFTLLPRRQLRLVVGLANVLVALVMCCAVLILAQSITDFSLAVSIELLLLLIQVWCLCGAAVPMSAKRFYMFFFHLPKPTHENTEWQCNK